MFYATKPSGGSWATEDLTAAASEVSLTTTSFSQGNVVPHIALVEATKFGTPDVQGHVMYATRSTGGVWSFEVVDPEFFSWEGAARSVSITLNTINVPRIAYILQPDDNNPYERVRLATRIGPNCWSIETVDSVGGNGSFDEVTLRMSAGSEVLTYGRLLPGATTFQFLYARRSGSSWVTEEIEPTALNPQNGVMTVPPNGVAQVAYMTVDGMLNYAYRLGPNNWVRTKLRPVLTYNVNRSIAIIHDPGNKPHIAYYSEGGDSLRYASNTGSGWSYQRVEQIVTSWAPLSIGVHSADPQKPKILFMNMVEGVGDAYFLAEGTQVLHGNLSARRSVEEGVSPDRASVSVSDGSVSPGGRVSLSVSQPQPATVQLILVDVAGRTIAQRAPEWLGAGRSSVLWDVGSPPSGVYFVQMKASSGAHAGAKIVIAR